MNATAKVTKTQRANLVRIWTERTAYGLVAQDRTFRTLIDSKTCQATGFSKMHANAQSSLIQKGLARVLTTKVSHSYTSYGKTYQFFVQVLVLTDEGRKVIGV